MVIKTKKESWHADVCFDQPKYAALFSKVEKGKTTLKYHIDSIWLK